MTNLDILSLALSYATGRSARYWAKVLQAIAKTDPVVQANLRTVPPDGAAKLEALRAEGAGILQWLLGN